MELLQKLQENKHIEIKYYSKKIKITYFTQDEDKVKKLLNDCFGNHEPEERLFIEGFTTVTYRRSKLKNLNKSHPINDLASRLEDLGEKIEVIKIQEPKDRIPPAKKIPKCCRPTCYY